MKAILVSILISLIGEVVTKENVKAILDFIFKWLNDKAKQTETEIDDYSLETVEHLLNEDELAVELTNFIKTKIKA